MWPCKLRTFVLKFLLSHKATVESSEHVANNEFDKNLLKNEKEIRKTPLNNKSCTNLSDNKQIKLNRQMNTISNEKVKAHAIETFSLLI